MSDEITPPQEPAIEEPAPLVFLSYSHDTKEHKQWVSQLAQDLLHNGVQVLIDQWDLSLGDDLPKYMERAVTEADRVLMICSEEYVRKANDGKGGVGYEAMIVTAELVKNLGTKKFIPIIRQQNSSPSIPTCVSSRLYINLSDGTQHDEQFQELLRELHQIPAVKKPPLGSNPFLGESFASHSQLQKTALREADFTSALEDPEKTYDLALETISGDDKLKWRRLLRAAASHGSTTLNMWKSDHSIAPKFDRDNPEDLFIHAEQGVICFAPFIACIVAAAESDQDGYADQLGWIDAILKPEGWEQSGSIYWVDFPDAILFVAQALIGGMLMNTQSGRRAYHLATSEIANKYRTNEKNPIYSNTRITGWPESLSRHCSVAWAFLDRIIDSWPWFHELFGSAKNARISITSYYLLLNFLNFVKLSKSGNFEREELEWAVTAPLMFCKWGSEICNDAYDLYLCNQDLLTEVCRQNGIIDSAKFEGEWKAWIAENGRWIGQVFGHFIHDLGFPHKDFPLDLNRDPHSLKL